MSGLSEIPILDAAAIAAALSPGEAVDALEAALRGGLDPEADPPRAAVGAEAGEVLLMPSSAPGAVGVKLVTVAPGNPDRGRPRIQGVYVLFDPETLAPAALLDGIGLTDLRTSAVSALAVRHLAVPDARRLLVFGTGAQARAHVGALRAVQPGIERVDVVARDRRRLEAFVARCAAEHGVDGPRSPRRTPSARPTSSSAPPPRASRCSTARSCATTRPSWRSARTSPTPARSTSASPAAPRSSSSRGRQRCARRAT